MKAVAQRMVVIDGVVYRMKHVSNDGKWLYFAADGKDKLDPAVMWEFSAANEKPIKPYMWYEDDEGFKEYHLQQEA